MNRRQTFISKFAMLSGIYVASVIMYVGGILILTMGSTYAQNAADSESQVPNSRAYLNCRMTGQVVSKCSNKWISDSSRDLIEKWLSADDLNDQTRKWLKERKNHKNQSNAWMLPDPEFFELRSLWSPTLPERLADFEPRL